MKFTIKKPCECCPFRTDVHPYLHRAPQIANSLRDDNNWFACHETTGIKTGNPVSPAEQSQCAGSMIVLWRSGLQNVAMRLALAFGMLEQANLEANVPVFNSLEEFVEHHECG